MKNTFITLKETLSTISGRPIINVAHKIIDDALLTDTEEAYATGKSELAKLMPHFRSSGTAFYTNVINEIKLLIDTEEEITEEKKIDEIPEGDITEDNKTLEEKSIDKNIEDAEKHEFEPDENMTVKGWSGDKQFVTTEMIESGLLSEFNPTNETSIYVEDEIITAIEIDKHSIEYVNLIKPVNGEEQAHFQIGSIFILPKL